MAVGIAKQMRIYLVPYTFLWYPYALYSLVVCVSILKTGKQVLLSNVFPQNQETASDLESAGEQNIRQNHSNPNIIIHFVVIILFSAIVLKIVVDSFAWRSRDEDDDKD